MTVSFEKNQATNQFAELGQSVLGDLAAQFPICMSSDAFCFFPHFRSLRPKWSHWDDFTVDGLKAILAQMEKWRQQIEQLQALCVDLEAVVDLEMLDHVLVTLQEQIEWVRPHESQPTFYLTIVSMGLAEALDDSYTAFGRRLHTLPAFFQSAKDSLLHVSALNRYQGIAMTDRIKAWVGQMPLTGDERPVVEKAFGDFRRHLMDLAPTEGARLSTTVYARIVEHHIGSNMGLEEIGWHLDQEIEESLQALSQTAGQIAPGKPWSEVWQTLPNPMVGPKEGEAIFRSTITKLKAHCMAQGFWDIDAFAECDVALRPTPEHLMPMHANTAYSMPPGHPPKGGTYFINPMGRQGIPRDMLLLAAHGTYPGHHLLDTVRWQHDNPLRRSMVFPIFYEGWACFAEEILFDTHLLSGPVDRLLAVKRRYLRALRGRADFDIHTGKKSLQEAAETLSQDGAVASQEALKMVQRYALKPGYQLAYSLGRRKFRQLYTAFMSRGNTPAQFVRRVIAEGEVGFEHLAERLLY